MFKDEYRARVDAAPWDEDEQSRIVDEIKLAFRLNTRDVRRPRRFYQRAAAGVLT